MDILALIAAFGGGIIGAYMGALPAFIMTGIYALVGGVLTAAGVGGDVAVNYLAFGSFVGPHIAFAGGVAAAGYAGRKGKLASGTDILSSLNGLGEPDVLLVGGIPSPRPRTSGRRPSCEPPTARRCSSVRLRV